MCWVPALVEGQTETRLLEEYRWALGESEITSRTEEPGWG